MRKSATILFLAVTCVLLWAPTADARDYAVLISAGEATQDDAICNCEYWYDMLLQYTTLLDEGYTHNDIYVLYGFGVDFDSEHWQYQVPYTVSDYPANRDTIGTIFDELGEIMTERDKLYVWWMGHGSNVGEHLRMLIQTTGEYVWDYEFAEWVSQVQSYDRRSFSFMTCHSGGILDDLQGWFSIVMSSSTLYQSSYSAWLCDSYHAEFHYYETCAFHWETPAAICGTVDADDNLNGRVSFREAFGYAVENTLNSTPQMSDMGHHAPYTYLNEDWVFVYPLDYQITEGLVVSGGFRDLLRRDDHYLVIGPDIPNECLQVVVNGVVHSTSTDPAQALRFTLESHANTNFIKQTIELYNFATGSYEHFDVRAATCEDSVIKVFTDDTQQYINPMTGDVAARVTWYLEMTPIWPVYAYIDQTVWEVLP